MIPYVPPLDDIRFVLTRLIGTERLALLPGYEIVGEELIDAVLDETAKIASDVFAPLNGVGDKTGVTLKNGVATMPAGFKDAYLAYIEGGWNGLPVEEQWGGQGLPWALAMPVQEMLQAANISLALCTLLNQGAVEALIAHGSDELKRLFLPKLVSGEWTGVMNLTESQAGSDVGAVQCRAIRSGEHYLLTGQKIFISYGDHDMTENVVHLVLARLPDAPQGTKGLSLFLVPKINVNQDGSLGAQNDVHVASIEHKLGQHASPTCVMVYGDKGGANAFLIGAEHGGIAAMFTMMNNARLGVGIQGLGLMERAYQQALDYARTRVQGRDLRPSRDKATAAQSVTILHHPDVRRMLMLMRCHIEASRALVYMCGYSIDVSKRSASQHDRDQHGARVDLLTPVIKAWLTDLSNEITSTALQVFGGMGYIEETGVAQHMRDARVLAIYEGTNGIQANDLVFRKLMRDGGKGFNYFIEEMDIFRNSLKDYSGDDFLIMSNHFAASLNSLQETSKWLLATAPQDPDLAASAATTFLRLLGNTAGGYYLIQSAALAHHDLALGSAYASFAAAKIVTARFYAEQVLAMNSGLATAVLQGSQLAARLQPDYF